MHSNNRRALEMGPGIYKGKRVPCRGAACDAGAGVLLVSRVVRLLPRFVLPSVVVAAKPLLHLRLSASFARKVVVACVHRSFAGNTRMIRFSSSSSLPPAASSSLLTLSSPHIDMLL
jgi:hypothetical protein